MSDVLQFTTPAKSLVLWAETIGTLVSEWTFRVNDNAIESCFVDPAHVAMGTARLSPITSLADAPKMQYATDFEKLVERVKLLEPKEEVDVRVSMDKTDGGMRIKQGRFTRSIGLVDPVQFNDPKVPKIELDGRASIDLEALKKGLKMANQVSDHVALVLNEDEALLIAEGDVDKDQIVVGIPYPNAEKSKALYSIDYLVKMAIAMEKLSPHCDAMWGNDYPLTLTSGDTPSKVNARFMLAPRII
jgi:hypothetical protein